jgi:alkanesulfonate monooxygenase SsuD/methylene tetrahydromethanopterin reductase-like flavin-dependent oxidoreductase (luciferase family)
MMSLPASRSESQLHAQWAQDLAFDSLWTGDHLRHPREVDAPFLDGWSVLAAWAATTANVELGMLVSNLIYRHPAVLARQAAAVDVISAGRVTLGVGTGVYATDSAMVGQQEWSPAERVGRLDEAVEIIDRLLRGEMLDFSGRYYELGGAAVRPVPRDVGRPPLLIGAIRPRAIDVAVRRADVWSTWVGFAPDTTSAVEAVRAQCGLVDTACERHGRSPSTLRRSLCVFPPLDPWASVTALEQLVERFEPMGIDELVVYAPPQQHEDLMEQALGRLAR